MTEYIPREVILKCIEEEGRSGEYDLGYDPHNREFQELIMELPAADVKSALRAMPKKTTIWPAKYDAAHTVQIHLKLNTEKDKDILDKLKQVESKQGYIKRLIRKDIGSRPD